MVFSVEFTRLDILLLLGLLFFVLKCASYVLFMALQRELSIGTGFMMWISLSIVKSMGGLVLEWALLSK